MTVTGEILILSATGGPGYIYSQPKFGNSVRNYMRHQPLYGSRLNALKIGGMEKF